MYCDSIYNVCLCPTETCSNYIASSSSWTTCTGTSYYWNSVTQTCGIFCHLLYSLIFWFNFVIFPNNYKTVAYALYGADCSSTLCLPFLNGNSLSLQCLSTATESNCPNTLTGYHCDCLSTQYYDTTYGCSMKLNNIL